VRRALGTRAVGHAGTLDPFATGLLVVLVDVIPGSPASSAAGQAVSRGRDGGTATDTDDRTGSVVTGAAAWPDAVGVRAALDALETYPQLPPAYRPEGRRPPPRDRPGWRGAGLEPREVTVHAITLLRWSPRRDDRSGGFGRDLAIARDLGQKLGAAAHCSALRREAIGPFRAEDAIQLDRLASDSPLLSPLALLGDMPRVELDAEGLRAVEHGRAVPAAPGSGVEAALVVGERLVAVAAGRDGWWHPRVVLEAA
jgi:tRNA pseudouridine55 synthase